MAKQNKERKVEVTKIEKPLIKLNSLFNELIDTISYNTFKSDTNREKELKLLSDEIDNVLYSEIKSLTQFTGDDISIFLSKLFNDYENKSGINKINDMQDIFSEQKSDLFEFFNQRYNNRNLLYEDLKTICSQLYELDEAVTVTRDAIITADDISQTVSRTLKFKNSKSDDTTKQSFVSIIENTEKKLKLLPKIKNHIIPKTLQYGKYYVYTIPYSKLFANYAKSMDKQRQHTLESFIDDSFISDISSSIQGATNKITKSAVLEFAKDIEVINEEIPIPILEKDLSASVLNYSDELFKKNVQKATKINKKASTLSPDGVKNVDSKEFEKLNVSGCYIKLIDPRKLIPVKIMDFTLGYYYIYENPIKKSKSPFTTSIKINDSSSVQNENMFLTKLTDKIVQAFNKDFLDENMKFKELILNSLQYNELYKKQIKFQFIPTDYITEFSVNEDEEGEGTSILIKPLFYAKLYLSLLIFKMITIISKSNDTKIYYVKQSGADTNTINKTMEIARDVKSKQMNFTDLLNYNSLISKIGSGKDIFMPVGRSGEHGIEFDILSGQDVQLNTDLMEMLRSAYISSTGVPSVIMNYINEADYAKTLVMANSKFVGRVVSFQLDFNPAVTEFYRKVMKFTGTILDEEIMDDFEFTFTAPKSVNNMNMMDLVNNTEQLIQFVTRMKFGENAEADENTNKLKDLFVTDLTKEMLPMLPWNNIDKIYEESKIKLSKFLADKKLIQDNENADNAS